MSPPPSTTPAAALRCFGLYVVGCISGGFIPGQAIFSQLFAEAGLFATVCDQTPHVRCPETQIVMIANIMMIVATLVITAMLPAGIIFDSFGGRITGTLGCVVLLCGVLVLIGLLLLGNDDRWLPYQPAVFTLGVVLCDVGSLTNNVAFFAFLW